jgi:putative hydrolases of HD superfamily
MKELQLVNFLMEAGKLTNIKRKLHAIGSKERESVASHVYHMIFIAVLLLEDKLTPEQLIKVIKLILIHDLGEIGADDLPFNQKNEHQANLEEAIYKKMVELLPSEKQKEYFELWREFEDNLSIEATYAKGIDKLQSQIVCYAQLLNNPNYQYINDSTVEQCERLIWGHMRKVFPEYEFLVDKITPSLIP